MMNGWNLMMILMTGMILTNQTRKRMKKKKKRKLLKIKSRRARSRLI